MDQKKIVEDMFNKGILISQELLNKELNKEPDKKFNNFFFEKSFFEKIEQEEDLLVLNSDYTEIISQQTNLVDWYEIDKYRVEAEKDRDDELYQTQLQTFKKTNLTINNPSFFQKQEISNLEAELRENQETKISIQSTATDILPEKNILDENLINKLIPENKLSTNKVEIIVSYQNKPHKYEVKNFTQIFISRLNFFTGLLRNRRELQQLVSINRLLNKKERETVAVIGLIEEISETKNKNIMLTVEDLTGRIKVFIPNNKPELYAAGKDLVLDEVIGISGTLGDKII